MPAQFPVRRQCTVDVKPLLLLSLSQGALFSVLAPSLSLVCLPPLRLPVCRFVELSATIGVPCAATRKAELAVKQEALAGKLGSASARQALEAAVSHMQQQLDATQALGLADAASEPDSEQERAEVRSRVSGLTRSVARSTDSFRKWFDE